MLKQIIAKKLLGLKTIDEKSLKQHMHKQDVMKVITSFYKRHEALSPKRNGINFSNKRFQELLDEIMDY